ncbi:MAG: HAMP domain-containing histidine kinase [Deltaproteobacteria bacterium]|nr:HAMP domain-containing histidine kinase [Deltaproteobacteria bacterium]
MNGSDTSGGQRGGLRFFGRMTANLSHEFNNIITIIGEVAGLLDDLLLLAEKGRPLNTEKLKSLSDNVKRQVERGKAVVKHMNFLGHSIDDRSREVDLGVLVENVTNLSKRIAERKGVALAAEPAVEPVVVNCDPFGVMQAVFLCVDAALGAGAVGVPIKIGVRRVEAGAEIAVESAAFEPFGSAEAKLEDAGHLAAQMRAEFASQNEGEKRVAKITFQA